MLQSGRLLSSMDEIIEMKATEQYFPVVLFIMLYKMVLRLESEDNILKKRNYSKESY